MILQITSFSRRCLHNKRLRAVPYIADSTLRWLTLCRVRERDEKWEFIKIYLFKVMKNRLWKISLQRIRYPDVLSVLKLGVFENLHVLLWKIINDTEKMRSQ